MEHQENELIRKVEQYVSSYVQQYFSEEHVFHNLEHMRNVADAVLSIAEGYDLTAKEFEILQLAAWFHDVGYGEGPKGHEERSTRIARDFLEKENYDEISIQRVERAILSTKRSSAPTTLIDQILCDADVSHLGSLLYWDQCGRLRQELAVTQGIIMSEKEWFDFELHFMQQHEYYTEVARKQFEDLKQKHIRQLRKRRLKLYPDELEIAKRNKEEVKDEKKSKEKNKSKENGIGRGVETMYRTTYMTHINLSSIADNKANIMLSINAIITSIVVSTLVPKFIDNPKLIIPTLLLLLVCLISIIFATLSTRPKVTEGKFTREDIEQRRANLLFFGNFYNMTLEDYQWGMKEMIKDNDFLYSSMTKDLYYLGKVLAKKYKFLSICYNIFMYGIILVVLVFAITFSL
jgi:predicted metal-dependent HD superfamily phosphohydrolase